MNDQLNVACDACGSTAPVVMNAHEAQNGRRIEWPKAATKEDGIYFSIDCPQCGERDQRMAITNGDE